MFSFAGSFCFTFLFVSFVLGLFCFLLLLFVVLPVTPSRGEGTRQRTRWGGTTANRPGVFLFHPSGFSFFSFFVVVLFYFLLLCYCSPYFEYKFPFLLFFICFLLSSVLFFIYFPFRFISCFIVFLFSLFSVSGYYSWHIYWYVGSVIAWHNGIALYYLYCCLPGTM